MEYLKGYYDINEDKKNPKPTKKKSIAKKKPIEKKPYDDVVDPEIIPYDKFLGKWADDDEIVIKKVI